MKAIIVISKTYKCNILKKDIMQSENENILRVLKKYIWLEKALYSNTK